MKGFQFRKSLQLLPGVRLNFSKSGASVSLGPEGAHVTAGPKGTWFFLDLPGSGAYYRKKISSKSSKDGGEKDSAENAPQVSFIDRLTTPALELDLIDAVRAASEGREDEAYAKLAGASDLPDAAFLAGFLALKRGAFPDAVTYLTKALNAREHLGEAFKKHEIAAAVELPITEDIFAQIEPNERGVLLALAEAYQHSGMAEPAVQTLENLQRLDPDDLVVRLSLAELYDLYFPEVTTVQQAIVKLAENVHNEGPVHAGLMYYRAKALRKLGLLDGALETLTQALRRKKDYPADLLRALRYERAVIYEATGKLKEAHKEYQAIYAEMPTYEDVAARLGL